MLRVSTRLGGALRASGSTPGLRAAVSTTACRAKFEDDHVLLSEQEQGQILERLQDPQEVARVLAHMKTKSTFGDTMADTILRESLEARKADLEARMAARDQRKVLCEHGHEHDLCCGGGKGQNEPEE